jgi:exonuclease SbcC
MVRIGHTGDLHVSRGPRFELARECLNFIVTYGNTKAEVDVWLVGGDLTGTTVPHKSEPEERNLVAQTLQAMAGHAPVIVAEGNHDFPGDLAIYAKLRAEHPIHVVTKPEIRVLHLPAGGVMVFVLPYPTKRWGNVTEKGGVEAALRDLLNYWRGVAAEARSDGFATVLLAHVAIGGCLVGGGEVLIGREVELAPHDLDELGVDCVLLSHIHKQQQIARVAWYAGSPWANNFGEPDPKGFLLADVESGQPPVVTVVPTPARRMVTIDVAWVPRTGPLGGFRGVDGKVSVESLAVQDAEVRIRVTLDEENAATCPLDELDAMATAAGAYRVVVERHIRPRVRSRLEALPAPASFEGGKQAEATLADAWQAATSLAEKLRLWTATLGRDAPAAKLVERAAARLPELAENGATHAEAHTATGQARDISLQRVRLRHVSAAFQASDVALDVAGLGPGLVALVGENGEGKTVLMEASGPAALYGVWPSYGLDACKDMVVPGIRDAEVEAVYLVDGVEVVTRWRIDTQANGGRGKTEAWVGVRNPDGSLAPLPGAAAPTGPGVSEHHQAIADLFPGEPLFLAAWFAAQGRRGAAANFFGLAKRDRKDLFLAMLGLGHLQTLAEAADDRAAACEEPLFAARRELEAAEEALATAGALDARLAEWDAAAGGLDAAAATLNEEWLEAQQTYAAAREALARAEAQDDAAVARTERLTSERVERGTEASTVKRRIAELDARLTERPKLEAAAAPRESLDIEVKAIVARLNELLRPDGKLAEARSVMAQLTERRENLLAEWNRLSLDLTAAQDASQRIEAAVPEGWETLTEHLVIGQEELQALREQVDGLDVLTAERETAAASEAEAAVARETQAREEHQLAKRAALLSDIPGVPACDACPLTAEARNARDEASRIGALLAATPAPTEDAREALAAHRLTLTEHRQALRSVEKSVDQLTRTRTLVERDAPFAARVNELTAARYAVVEKGQRIAARLTETQAIVREALQLAEQTKEELRAAETKLHAATQAATALTELATVSAERTQAAARLAGLVEWLNTPVTMPARSDLDAPRRAIAVAEQGLRHTHRWTEACTSWQRALDVERGRARGQREALGDPPTARDAAATRVEELDRTASEWTLLARALGRDGIQACEIDAAGPAVAALANDLLLTCYGPRFTLALDTQAAKVAGGVKEVFDVRILDAQTGREAREGSGGEQAILNEALALALAIWNAQRSGWHVRTLWRDETTAALTAAHAARYVTMLRRAAELGGFMQVLLVSHQESVWQSADARVHVEGGTVRVADEEPKAEAPAAAA